MSTDAHHIVTHPAFLDIAIPGGPATLTQISRGYPDRVVAAFRGGFADESSQRPIGRFGNWSREINGPSGNQWPMLVVHGDEARLAFEDDSIHGFHLLAAGGPILLRDGEVVEEEVAGIPATESEREMPRTVIGIRADGALVIAALAAATLSEAAGYLKGQHCLHGLGYAGGNGTQVQTEGRLAATWGSAPARLPWAFVVRSEPRLDTPRAVQISGSGPVPAEPDRSNGSIEPGATSEPATATRSADPVPEVVIEEDFIPAGRRNRPGFRIDGPRVITVHDTGNPAARANARAHAAYLLSQRAQDLPVSWHFTVDDQRIIQHLPIAEVGWHAGDGGSGPGNRTSIGIEICQNADGDRARAEAHGSWLVAHLLRQQGMTVDQVVQHNRWTGKACPGVIRERQGGWQAFNDQVRAHLSGEEPQPAIELTTVPAVDVPPGTRGPAVKALQRLLNMRFDAALSEDGVYGARTEPALKVALRGQ